MNKKNSFKTIVDEWKKRAKNLKDETYALYLVYRHPQTPWLAKILTGIIVAYAFSPIDLIPDFIPVLGYLDDLILVPLGITLILKMIPDNVMNDCRNQAQIEMKGEKPVNRFAAVIIVLVWVSFAILTINWLIDLFG